LCVGSDALVYCDGVTFELEPTTGESISINGWNWRPTLELLHRTGILSDEALELMSFNGGGGEVTPDEAGRISEFLDGYLARLGPDDRVMLDGAVTTEPDTGEFHRDDLARNYSATFAWLVRFRDFCRSSGGFQVY
jgi:hypothetical protein